MDRVGRQSPTVSVILPYTATKGPEAIELYNKSEKEALEWQTALTYDIMAFTRGGKQDRIKLQKQTIQAITVTDLMKM